MTATRLHAPEESLRSRSDFCGFARMCVTEDPGWENPACPPPSSRFGCLCLEGGGVSSQQQRLTGTPRSILLCRNPAGWRGGGGGRSGEKLITEAARLNSAALNRLWSPPNVDMWEQPSFQGDKSKHLTAHLKLARSRRKSCLEALEEFFFLTQKWQIRNRLRSFWTSGCFTEEPSANPLLLLWGEDPGTPMCWKFSLYIYNHL